MKLKSRWFATLLIALPVFALAQESSAAKSASLGSDRDNPELADVIRSYSKRTGKKFIVDPRVRATGGLVGIDPDKITYEQLLALASVHGFVAVAQGDLIIVTVDAAARQTPSPVYTDARFKAIDDEWVTLLLTVRNACAGQLVPVLRPLMPQAAHLAANLQTNQIIVGDRAINARRIAGMIDKIDEAAPAGQKCSTATSLIN